MKHTKASLFYVALPVVALMGTLALWHAAEAPEIDELTLGESDREPVDARSSNTVHAADLETIPVAPLVPEPAPLASGAAEELAATGRESRRTIVQPGTDPLLGTDAPTVDNVAWSKDMLRIISDRNTAQGVLLNSEFQIFTSGEVHIRSLRVEPLKDGLQSTEHSPGVPASQGYVKGGLQTGLWTTWHANGEKESEGRYTYGQMHGPWTTWHDSGEKDAEGEYQYGKREGPWIEYHSNGKKRETATYVNGQRDGRVTRWHVNGQRKAESFESYGRQHLEAREWYINGQESRRGTFEYGLQVGRLRVWNSDGSVDEAASGVFENGQKVAD